MDCAAATQNGRPCSRPARWRAESRAPLCQQHHRLGFIPHSGDVTLSDDQKERAVRVLGE